MSLSIILSIGSYGGFYFLNKDHGWTEGRNTRLCLGWVSIDLLSPEIDMYLDKIGKAYFGSEWE